MMDEAVDTRKLLLERQVDAVWRSSLPLTLSENELMKTQTQGTHSKGQQTCFRNLKAGDL